MVNGRIQPRSDSLPKASIMKGSQILKSSWQKPVDDVSQIVFDKNMKYILDLYGMHTEHAPTAQGSVV